MSGQVMNYAAITLSLKRRHLLIWLLVAPVLFLVVAWLGHRFSHFFLDLSPVLIGAVALLELLALFASFQTGVWMSRAEVTFRDDAIEKRRGKTVERLAYHDIRRIIASRNAQDEIVRVRIEGSQTAMEITRVSDLGSISTKIRMHLPVGLKMESEKSSSVDWDDCLTVTSVILTVWSFLFAAYLALKDGAPEAYLYATIGVPVVSALWLLFGGRKSPQGAEARVRREEVRDGSLVFCFSLIWVVIEFLC